VRSRFGPYLRVTTRFLPLSTSSTVQPAKKPSCCRISAMCTLILECGIDTVSRYAWFALRTRVSMSAIGSVMVIGQMALSRRGSRRRPVGRPGLRRSDGAHSGAGGRTAKLATLRGYLAGADYQE